MPTKFLIYKVWMVIPPARTVVDGQGTKEMIVLGDPTAEGQIKAANHSSSMALPKDLGSQHGHTRSCEVCQDLEAVNQP